VLVPDVYRVGVGTGHLVEIGSANEDAAVGVVINPEFGPDLKVGVSVLGN
jgi:hypothetical protein